MDTLGFGSLCVKEVKDHLTTKPHILPIYATSSFVMESIDQAIDIFKGEKQGHVYSRYGNPTIEAVADKISRMECYGLDLEARAILFSSGMSAIATLLMGVLQSGDKVLTQGNLYGGTTELLLKVLAPLGIETQMVNLRDLERVEDYLRQDANIRMIYCETPANPTMACVDLAALGALARKYQCHTAVDNTFCTPYLQQPFRYDIDFIVHSTTKYLNGHGNSTAGIVIGRDVELMQKKVWTAMKLTGTNCNPFDAWLTHNGLKTLELRMDRHCSNAQRVAEYLEQHPAVERVNYNGLPSHPDHELAKSQMSGFGGMLSFELRAGLQAGIDFMNRIRFCTLAPTLGDVDTLVVHPASSSHLNVAKEVRLRNGITDGLVRLSVGIENPADIIADLEQAIG
ncbi:MAG: aminotransferase class I/II-fold pyridoxal phosphate-dependent enzyme [Bacteroidota bacterium]